MANVAWRVETGEGLESEGERSYGRNVPKCYMEWDIWEILGEMENKMQTYL